MLIFEKWETLIKPRTNLEKIAREKWVRGLEG